MSSRLKELMVRSHMTAACVRGDVVEVGSGLGGEERLICMLAACTFLGKTGICGLSRKHLRRGVTIPIQIKAYLKRDCDMLPDAIAVSCRVMLAASIQALSGPCSQSRPDIMACVSSELESLKAVNKDLWRVLLEWGKQERRGRASLDAVAKAVCGQQGELFRDLIDRQAARFGGLLSVLQRKSVCDGKVCAKRLLAFATDRTELVNLTRIKAILGTAASSTGLMLRCDFERDFPDVTAQRLPGSQTMLVRAPGPSCSHQRLIDLEMRANLTSIAIGVGEPLSRLLPVGSASTAIYSDVVCEPPSHYKRVTGRGRGVKSSAVRDVYFAEMIARLGVGVDVTGHFVDDKGSPIGLRTSTSMFGDLDRHLRRVREGADPRDPWVGFQLAASAIELVQRCNDSHLILNDFKSSNLVITVRDDSSLSPALKICDSGGICTSDEASSEATLRSIQLDVTKGSSSPAAHANSIHGAEADVFSLCRVIPEILLTHFCANAGDIDIVSIDDGDELARRVHDMLIASAFANGNDALQHWIHRFCRRLRSAIHFAFCPVRESSDEECLDDECVTPTADSIGEMLQAFRALFLDSCLCLEPRPGYFGFIPAATLTLDQFVTRHASRIRSRFLSKQRAVIEASESLLSDKMALLSTQFRDWSDSIEGMTSSQLQQAGQRLCAVAIETAASAKHMAPAIETANQRAHLRFDTHFLERAIASCKKMRDNVQVLMKNREAADQEAHSVLRQQARANLLIVTKLSPLVDRITMSTASLVPVPTSPTVSEVREASSLVEIARNVLTECDEAFRKITKNANNQQCIQNFRSDTWAPAFESHSKAISERTNEIHSASESLQPFVKRVRLELLHKARSQVDELIVEVNRSQQSMAEPVVLAFGNHVELDLSSVCGVLPTGIP